MAIYFYFLLDDAIASAGGTQIKYVDTKTTVDISRYGNILGAKYLESWDSGTRIGLVLLKNINVTAFYRFSSSSNNGYDVDFSLQRNIRVFYF